LGGEIVQYRAVGSSGLRISAIALGSWLTYGGPAVQEETAISLVRRAYELGVTYFDTADVYQMGAAEELLARALEGIPRESVVLATKCFWPVGEGPNDRGLSRKHVFESVHRSLRRLRTDYVDIFFMHRFDPTVPLEETLSTLDHLVKAGKVLYVGISEWRAADIERALGLQALHGWDPIRVSQPAYNLLNRKIEHSVIPVCERHGIGQVVWSPLAEGFLTGKYVQGQPPPPGSRAADGRLESGIREYMVPENYRRVERLKAVADAAGMPLARLALAWTLRLPNVAAAITGATRLEQLEENVQAADVTLDAATLDAIEKALAV
jgi:aryl-alcohol dehydrogenase-like predicted oxidoreductase